MRTVVTTNCFHWLSLEVYPTCPRLTRRSFYNWHFCSFVLLSKDSGNGYGRAGAAEIDVSVDLRGQRALWIRGSVARFFVG